MIHRNVRGGQPSPYPRWPFHGLRAAQLLSSVVVTSIMAYFMHFLRLWSLPEALWCSPDVGTCWTKGDLTDAGKFQIPWTFIVLLSVSLATIASLAITIFLYNFRFLSPRYNLITNGAISAIWAMGFGMLSWSISNSNVLGKTCSIQAWKEPAAVSVCRDYKALWSMTFVATYVHPPQIYGSIPVDFEILTNDRLIIVLQHSQHLLLMSKHGTRHIVVENTLYRKTIRRLKNWKTRPLQLGENRNTKLLGDKELPPIKLLLRQLCIMVSRHMRWILDITAGMDKRLNHMVHWDRGDWGEHSHDMKIWKWGTGMEKIPTHVDSITRWDVCWETGDIFLLFGLRRMVCLRYKRCSFGSWYLGIGWVQEMYCNIWTPYCATKQPINFILRTCPAILDLVPWPP